MPCFRGSLKITNDVGDPYIKSKKSIQKDFSSNFNSIDTDDKINRNAYDSSKSLEQTMHLPRSIYCPITRAPMLDPVICADGYSYERVYIEEWLKKSNRSPITNEPFVHSYVIPNHSLRMTITEVMENM